MCKMEGLTPLGLKNAVRKNKAKAKIFTVTATDFLKVQTYISVGFFPLWPENDISLAEKDFIKLNNSSLRSSPERKATYFIVFIGIHWVKNKEKRKIISSFHSF